MSALENLQRLVIGVTVAEGVLGACRLESGNVDAFGIEAVNYAFRRAPMADTATGVVVPGQGHLALFNDSEAVVADLFGENVGRLWRIGQAEPGTPEPAVGVAFDPDLRQARGAVFVSAVEHPALDPAALGRIEAFGHELVDKAMPGHATFRSRAFVVRAFGSNEQGCVLFAIHALDADPLESVLVLS